MKYLPSAARSFTRAISNQSGLRVLNDVCFNQVVVSVEAPSGSDPAAWTTRVVRALQADGTCYATPSYWHGGPVIRFSFCNAATTEADVQRIADALIRAVASAA